MGRMECCLLLGAAIIMCPTPTGAADGAAKRLTVTVVATGRTDDHATTRAQRALTESLGALGARVTVRAMAEAGSSPTARHAVAVERRAAAPPRLDVVIGLSAKPVLSAGTYTAHLAMSLRAALYAVNGDRPPRILQARRKRRLPAFCPKACVARIGARMAEEQARALAPAIFRQARRVATRPARRLAFHGFSERELSEIRQYLRVFPGFRRMGHGVRRAKDWVIDYGSRLDDGALGSALKKMLGHMGIAAGVSRRGRGFTVARHWGPAQPGPASRQW